MPSIFLNSRKKVVRFSKPTAVPMSSIFISVLISSSLALLIRIMPMYSVMVMPTFALKTRDRYLGFMFTRWAMRSRYSSSP